MMQLEGLREGFTPTRLGPIHHVSAGQGPALFLIHGGHGGWQHWQANLLALARSHTVVAIDMPGYGLSADAPEDAGLNELARATWEAINAIRGQLPREVQQPPQLAAFSFGSLIATRIAAQQSANVCSLLLVNPPGLGVVSPDYLAIQGRASQAAREHGLRQGLDISLRELMLCQPQRMDDQALALLEFCVRHTRVVSRHLSRATQLIPLLAELPMPVQVLLGENDPHQRHELEARLARLEAVLGAEGVRRVAGAAHWLQYDQPELFHALALAFFARAGQAPAATL